MYFVSIKPVRPLRNNIVLVIVYTTHTISLARALPQGLASASGQYLLCTIASINEFRDYQINLVFERKNQHLDFDGAGSFFVVFPFDKVIGYFEDWQQ